MNTEHAPYAIHELVQLIYEDDMSHIDFMDNMNGGDCDCAVHITLNTIMKYWGDQ